MGYTTLAIDVSPNATAYDEDYPTRSTELLNHQLHEMLVDMDDATGLWYLTDESPTNNVLDTLQSWSTNMIEDVFDYAEGAIDTYRATGTPTLSKPTKATVFQPTQSVHPRMAHQMMKLYQECQKICWFIYYMWKTEEDPLLVKEKLQELLIAWPLMDTTIDLQTESGQTIRMYPSWKNVDLDL